MYFGLLTSLAMILALLANLTILLVPNTAFTIASHAGQKQPDERASGNTGRCSPHTTGVRNFLPPSGDLNLRTDCTNQKEVKMRTPLFLFALAGLALSFVQPAAAKTCELSITGDDQMQYNKPELVVAADCDEVKLTLEHVGEMSVQTMGHNWVLTETADFKAVTQEGQDVGLENDYLPQDDKRVIAHTDVIGGGKKTSVTFDTANLAKGGDYTFFCSFPGHWAVMNGKLIVK